ncbi:ABC transporter ATP-binding protein, partial [bacterium]|nr:ABC transporter ATP-binding protein [bacterium]
MKDLKRLLLLGKRHWYLVVFSLFASALVAWATMYNAEILRKLLDEVLVVPSGKNEAEHLSSQLASLNWIIVLAVLVTFAKGAGTFLQTYSMSYVCQNMIFRLKVEFFSKLQRLPLAYFATKRTGDLISRLNGDMLVIEQMLQTLIRIMVDPFVIFALVGYMFYTDWRLAFCIFIIVPILGVLVRFLSKKLRRAGKLLQDKVGDISALIQETVSGIKIIKAFRMERAKDIHFEKECKDNFRFSMKSVKYNALNSPVVELADAFGIAIMIYFGSRAVIDGRLTPGELIGFLTSLGLLFHPLKKLTNGNAVIQQSTGAVGRVFEVLDQEPETDSGSLSVSAKVQAHIEIQDLGFQFRSDKWVLDGINLSVQEGQVIALVGPSGGGKSSLVNLLPRFYTYQRGRILLDGEEITRFKLDEYRDLFGIVPQEVLLFRGTIEENVRLAKPDASFEKIQEACLAANAHDFIMSLEHGYQTHIAEM